MKTQFNHFDDLWRFLSISNKMISFLDKKSIFLKGVQNLCYSFPLYRRNYSQADYFGTAHKHRNKSHEADFIGHNTQHIH